jgi:hypothetical protein
MNKLYILEQRLATLEIILEAIVDELIDQELVSQIKLDKNIIQKIKSLSEKIEHEKIELIEDDDDNFELSINGIPFFGKKGEA